MMLTAAGAFGLLLRLFVRVMARRERAREHLLALARESLAAAAEAVDREDYTVTEGRRSTVTTITTDKALVKLKIVRADFGLGAAGRLLGPAAALLGCPADERGRWVEEWRGELAALPSRRAQWRWAVALAFGLPGMRRAQREPVRELR